MTFAMNDRVLYSVPTKFGYEVGRAIVKRVLEVTKHRIVPIYHIQCDNGVMKYVDADCLTKLLGSEPTPAETAQAYKLMPATEAV